MGKSTISMAIFNSELLNYQRVSHENCGLTLDFNEDPDWTCFNHGKSGIASQCNAPLGSIGAPAMADQSFQHPEFGGPLTPVVEFDPNWAELDPRTMDWAGSISS